VFSFAHVIVLPGRGHHQKFISTLIQRLAKVHISTYDFPPQNYYELVIRSDRNNRKLLKRVECFLPRGSESFVFHLQPVEIYDCNISLHVILPGCETRSLFLREEHRLRMFEKWVLRRTFAPEREETVGDWRTLHSEKL
jgi:hypothetical protein